MSILHFTCIGSFCFESLTESCPHVNLYFTPIAKYLGVRMDLLMSYCKLVLKYGALSDTHQTDPKLGY